MNQAELKYIDLSGTVKMKTVPIIGEAVQDGSLERKYIEKLEELDRTNQSNRLTAEQIEQIPSRLMR